MAASQPEAWVGYLGTGDARCLCGLLLGTIKLQELMLEELSLPFIAAICHLPARAVCTAEPRRQLGSPGRGARVPTASSAAQLRAGDEAFSPQALMETGWQHSQDSRSRLPKLPAALLTPGKSP